jgi:integrase
VRVVLSLGYGCGLRAGEVVRLQVKHIDSAQGIIRVEQAKGRKDRNVMLSPEVLALLRQWWTARTTRYDAGVVKWANSALQAAIGLVTIAIGANTIHTILVHASV